jgi:hypothetical protein
VLLSLLSWLAPTAIESYNNGFKPWSWSWLGMPPKRALS